MKVMYGSEDYFINEALRKFKKMYHYKEVDVPDGDARMFLNTTSLLDEREKIIIFYPKTERELTKLSDEWKSENNVLCVFYGALKKTDSLECKCFNKLTYEQLKKFVKEGLPTLDTALVEEFIKISGYLEDRCDMYGVVNEIRKIQCLKNVNPVVLKEVMGECDVEGNAFKEGEFLWQNDRKKAIQNVMNCPKGQEMGFIGALHRFFRVGWKLNYYSIKEVAYGTKIEPIYAKDAIEVLDKAQANIVSGRMSSKTALVYAILKILALRGEVRHG